MACVINTAFEYDCMIDCSQAWSNHFVSSCRGASSLAHGQTFGQLPRTVHQSARFHLYFICYRCRRRLQCEYPPRLRGLSALQSMTPACAHVLHAHGWTSAALLARANVAVRVNSHFRFVFNSFLFTLCLWNVVGCSVCASAVWRMDDATVG